MHRLPKDLSEYLRSHKLEPAQKAALRRLAAEQDDTRLTAAEVAARHVSRALRICRALDSTSARD